MEPLARLASDRARARAANDPMAALCILATVDANGRPQARTLVLRDLGERLALFLNATSPKFAQLTSAGASICLYMPSIQVQYRAQAKLTPIDPTVIAQSWQLRPHMPKVLDWFYTTEHAQSSNVATRETLQTMLASFVLPDPLIAPDTARGFYLDFDDVERLDLAQPNGLHDRKRWIKSGSVWTETTLLP